MDDNLSSQKGIMFAMPGRSVDAGTIRIEWLDPNTRKQTRLKAKLAPDAVITLKDQPATIDQIQAERDVTAVGRFDLDANGQMALVITSIKR